MCTYYCFSTGRVFVHEWAHLRWGVFDEYNNDAPFYVSINSKKASVEATRYHFSYFCFYFSLINILIMFSIFLLFVLSLYFVESL